MFQEKKLIERLTNALKNAGLEKPEPLTKDEANEIEKYRDDNGFINLTNVKNINDIKRIINIVDRKNGIEEYEKNHEENKPISFMDMISDMMMESLKNGVKYNISAKCSPDDTVKLSIKSDDDNDADGGIIKEDIEVKTNVDDTATSDIEEVVKLDADDEVYELDKGKVVVVLDNGSGKHNPLYFNAVQHICEIEYFPNNGVYTYNDVHPENIDILIILPNVWGKIIYDVAADYETFIEDGGIIYIINPETFELTKVENIWDYVMTITQEELN